MSEITWSNFQENYRILHQNRLKGRGSTPEKKDKITDNIKIGGKLQANNKNITYSKPQIVRNDTKQVESGEALKRMFYIDNSNNIFYVNYKGANQTVKIEPGEYDLLELRRAIQDKVNEKFGIDKVKVELTGSGSDRLVQGEDSKIFDFLI